MSGGSTAGAAGLTVDRLELLRLLAEDEGGGRSEAIPRRATPGRAPLSHAQERLWFLAQLDPANAAYNLPMALRLEGELEPAALAAALRGVVERHEILRTVFRLEEGESVQVVAQESEVAPAVVDLSALAGDRREAEALRLAVREARRPFDLERGPLLRFTLVRLAEGRHAVLVNLHHVVSDGWSNGLLVREMAELYAARRESREPRLPELPVQYGDYAAWQRERTATGALDRELDHWRERLVGIEPLELSTDRPRPPTKTYAGSAVRFRIDGRRAAAAVRLAREEGASLFMAGLAVFAALLARYSGQDDLAIGAPATHRSRRETEGLIGLFVNTLVLRCGLDGDPSFRRLLGRVRETTLDAYAHQEVPFERLVDELDPVRDLTRSPLFQALFALQNLPVRPRGLPGGLRMEGLGLDRQAAKFDLSLYLTETGGGIDGTLEYNTDLFDRTTALRLARSYRCLLGRVLDDPDTPLARLLIQSPEEIHQAVREWNDTDVRRRRGRLHDPIVAVAGERPDAVAVEDGDRALSYGELLRRARLLAGTLRSHGAGPEVRVGIFAERSLEMVVALLAVEVAGAAYLPLDPELPERRLRSVMEDARPRLLVRAGTEAEPPLDWNGAPPWIDPSSESGEAEGPVPAGPAIDPGGDGAAYVIYTSGSTGRPKGVVNSHRGIDNRLDWMGRAYGFGPGDRTLQKTPFGFDVSVWELFLPLRTGGCLVMARPGGHRDHSYLARTLVERRVTVLHFVPSMLEAFLRGGEEARALASPRLVVSSGEALTPDLVARTLALASAGLENLYGPTEAAVDVTARHCGPRTGRRPVPIGRPIENLRIHLVDRTCRPTPLGAGGELCIAGAGLARGYHGRPGRTGEAFVPDPFATDPGGRIYRTGDLARFRADGELEFRGRRDHQVKVRGHRVELEEIERTLAAHPGVAECVAGLRSAGTGEARIVAWLVPANGEAPAVEELRAFARERIPEYAVPAAFVSLVALPLTASGKADRRALPDPDGLRPDLEALYEPPATETEEVLARIWSVVLGVSPVGVRDDFFALGGDSILSLRVLGMARDRGFAVDLERMFRHRTVRELAAAIDSGVAEAEGAEAAGSVAPFELVPEADRERLPGGLDDAYPMTRLQLGMLYTMELMPDHPLFHNVNSFELRVPYDREKLDRAVAAAVARHPILRTSFHVTGFSEPLQLVHGSAELPVPTTDLRGRTPEAQERALERYFDAQETEPFALDRPPLLRFHVHRLTDDSFRFTLTEAHAIGDGWSLHANLAEIFETYVALLAGEEPPARPLLRSAFRDYVALERRAISSDEIRGFWRERLAGYEPEPIPSWPRSAAPGARRIEKIRLPVPVALAEELESTARRAAVPVKSLLLSVHLKVIGAITGQDDVVTGVLSNGRPETAGGDDVRGLFLNVLPLRFELGRGSWLDLARRVFAAERELLPRRRFPLAEIQKDFGRTRLLETEFNYIHFHVVEDLLRGGEVEVTARGGRFEQTDMTLTTTFGRSPVTRDLFLGMRYDTSRFDQGRARAIATAYLELLRRMAGDPEGGHRSHSPLPPGARHRLAVELGDRGAASPETLVHVRAEAVAAERPDAVALVCGRRAITAGAMIRAARRLAARLIACGVVPGSRVGISFAGLGPEQLVARLAVMYAGAAFCTLDPSEPPARLAALVEEARPVLLLAGDEAAGALPEPGESGVERLVVDTGEILDARGAEDETGRLPDVAPASPAYLAFTSGSTGRPKAVVATHRSVAGYLLALVAELRIGPDDTVAQVAAPVFDASVRDTFGPFLAGARVVLADPGDGGSPEALVDRVVRVRATAILSLVPSLLRELPEPAERPVLRLVATSGEPLSGADVAACRRRFGASVEVVNQYGPTEATMTSTLHRVPAGSAPGGPVPVGRPMPGVRVHVLDRDLHPVLPGTYGEIHVGGPGLGPGYLGGPARTADRFRPDPGSGRAGERLYRTGDRGRYLPDGTLEFAGRLDRQVKLRGVRVEPAEVEARLLEHEEVLEAVVERRELTAGDPGLVAWVIPAAGAEPTHDRLRRHLLERLSEVMAPSATLFLDRLPRLSNGKIDRGALPVPDGARPVLERPYVAPRTATEEALARLWGDLLGVERVGVEDDFFELGGHSLLAMRLIARVREAFGRELPLPRLFEEPTVAGLARVLAEEPERGAADERIRRAAADSGPELLERLGDLPDELVDQLLGDLVGEGADGDE